MLTTSEILKRKGNEAFSSKDYESAISYYSEAITIDPANHTLYSNRSGAYCANKNYKEAADDARKVIELRPEWARGHSRLGAALEGMCSFEEAEQSYRKALKLDPLNTNLPDDISRVQQKISQKKRSSSGSGNGSSSGNSFLSAEFLNSLRMNPAIAPLFSDPEFERMIDDISSNPQNITRYSSDPRMLQVMQALLGSVISGNLNNSGNNNSNNSSTTDYSRPMKIFGKSNPKKEAEEEKNLGNAEFRKGNYEDALEHYKKAISIDETNLVYYTNISSIFTKQGKYEEAIEICYKAIEIGRANDATPDAISRAYQKIALNQAALGNFLDSCDALSLALKEKDDPQFSRDKEKIESMLEKLVKGNEVDLEVAKAENEEGLKCMANRDYSNAVDHFSLAIIKSENEIEYYQNRAEAFTQLGEIKMALKDLQIILAFDPNNDYAYFKKGYCYFVNGDYASAQESFSKAKEIAPNNEKLANSISEIQRQIQLNKYDLERESISNELFSNPRVQKALSERSEDSEALLKASGIVFYSKDTQ